MYHFTIITLYICVCTHVCVFISLYPPHFYNLRLEKSCINENSCSTYYLQNSPSSNYVLELLTLASNWFHEYFLLISLWIRTCASNCKLLVSLAILGCSNVFQAPINTQTLQHFLSCSDSR